MRHWSHVFQVGFLAVLVLTITCSGVEHECGHTPLMPLEVGNTWAYAVCRMDSAGGAPDCYGEDTIRVRRVGELDGDEYYLTEQVMAFREAPDGLSMVGWYAGRVTAYDYFFRYPVADGATYEYASTKVDQKLMLVIVREEVMDVPAGTYRALTYRIYRGSGKPFGTFSFAPGVGLVRFTFPPVGLLEMLVSADLTGTGAQSVKVTNGICDP